MRFQPRRLQILLKPKEPLYMTKNKLMTSTFLALLAVTIVSAILWLPASDGGWNLGVTVALCSLIAVSIAVGVDALLHKVDADIHSDLIGSAIFGLIVTCSYSLGIPGMAQATDPLPEALLSAPQCFIYVALITLIGFIVFKKLVGLSGRKFVNPAAAAKLIVLLPFVETIFLAKDHYASFSSGGLGVPSLAGPIGTSVINGNGIDSFASYLQSCYSLPTSTTYTSLNQLMILQKFHGWIGGASSLAVIVVGVILFVVASRYLKWRITASYFVGVVSMALLMTAVYGGDAYVRLMFEVFIGSSIFLGFFMATEPESTPITCGGQVAFGAGLAVLTVLIQTYMNFFGGSILALVIMNLTTPTLDRAASPKPRAHTLKEKLPKVQAIAASKAPESVCIRCGACMDVCCHKLSPIRIKEAFDRLSSEALVKLHPDYCSGCGYCTFVCPAGIDLRKSVLAAKGV